MAVKPFVKWAGGKGQLLPDIRHKYPAGFGKKITRYCEPFVGGGAVFFDVLVKYQLDEILINDINAALMNTYMQIKGNIHSLLSNLQELQDDFWPLDEANRKLFFYTKRERFNQLKIHDSQESSLEKAVLFIFLNKTCFNGLFRVNRQGGFNVPMGAYKMPLICDANNLQAMSKLLQNVTIIHGDYQDCLPFADENTFIYIDPPYRPLTDTANFTSYTKTLFGDDEQRALGKFVDNLHAVGAKVVVSNSDPKNANKQDNFFDDLYKAYSISRVAAKRMINCNAKSRGSVSELLISNF